MSKGIQVGQLVWFDKPGYGRNAGRELMELKVKKVGRKFFYLETDHWREYTIDLVTLREVSDSNYNGRVYLLKEEWEQERELSRLRSVVSAYFRKGESRLPAQALAQIEYIIEQYPHP